ncbi:E3 ubiquitin-protein ligase RNF216-like, partial [Notechis scutatus]|uniref:E3 ubiquitin-protein ligase RNF216-like n=1 Tax=Notechis scutatus TaxID=8663 RepID=A0A6J1W220_9SAUR
MEDGGQKEVIDLNSFRSHRGKDRVNHRDEGLITISDSSDEDLPVMLDTPVNLQWEDEDDEDVVILMEVSPPFSVFQLRDDQPLIANKHGLKDVIFACKSGDPK